MGETNPQRGHYEVQRGHPSPPLHGGLSSLRCQGIVDPGLNTSWFLGLLLPPLVLEKYFGSYWTQATECNRSFVWFNITLMNKGATQSSHSSISSSNLCISSECLCPCQVSIKLNGTFRNIDTYGSLVRNMGCGRNDQENNETLQM